MKKLILSFILATICGISAFAQWYHWEVCESGQELKYIISGNETQGYKARITYARSGENGDYNSPGAKTGDLIIPSSVTYNGFTCPVYRIDDHAFDGCSRLTSVTIPNSVTSIGYSAFSGCSGLTSVTISNSVTSIENSAFNNCTGLTRVNYTGGVADWCEISFSTNPLNYAHNLYINNNLVTDLVIPNTVTEIKQFAFLGATCLTTITIPNSVTSIGDGAFYGCSGLTGTLTIPNSVTSIGSSAFWGCSGLSGALTIPNSVTSIEFSVFSGCSGLTEITIPNSVTSIGSYAFYGCSGLTEITIPNSVTSIGSAAFGGCRNLTSMTIPFVGGSATATESSASTCFGYIFGTTSYNGGSAAAQIYNSNLNPTVTYYIPSSLRSVSVTGGSLYTGAFSKCSRLTSVTLLDSITEIPKYTFYYCSGLASITIPNSVTSIGMSAFNNCSGLTNIYANPTTPPTIYYVSTFSSYTATVWVPCGSAAAYSAAYGWSNFSEIRERFPYTLNVSSADLSMGTASVTQQPTCTDATAVITATPNNGYAFQQWNDGNTDNPRTINVSDDGEYIAYFGALYTITLTSADETMGTVSGGGTYINTRVRDKKKCKK